MRFTTIINNLKAIEWDLSIQEAYLFAWIYELPSWADKMQIEGDTFYFASKNKAVEELPILTTKIDTMYRYYKSLSDKKLITVKKVDGKDYIALTKKAKTWNLASEINPSLGNKSERSEKNPINVGKKSELDSEKNPTYNNTSINKEISNNNSGGVPKLQNVFTPPTEQEVKAYFTERTGVNGVASQKFAEKFIGHYTINDWKYGKNKTQIKDWKAAARTSWDMDEYVTKYGKGQKGESTAPKSQMVY